MTTTATGINLSAFGSARRPTLAAAEMGDKGSVRIKLSPAAAFGGKHKLSDNSEALFAQWRAGLLEMPRPIGVDVAIDIDALSMGGSRRAPAARQLWELTHRPIDFAFYGDAPITDRVGEFGTRFRAMLAASAFELGDDLIEVFPRATVELLEFRGQYLDGAVHHGGKGWKADDRNARGDKLMAKILEELGINPGDGVDRVSSDDLDATLCALTALGAKVGEGMLAGAQLDAEVRERVARRGNSEPFDQHAAPSAAAVLARPFWTSITLTR